MSCLIDYALDLKSRIPYVHPAAAASIDEWFEEHKAYYPHVPAEMARSLAMICEKVAFELTWQARSQEIKPSFAEELRREADAWKKEGHGMQDRIKKLHEHHVSEGRDDAVCRISEALDDFVYLSPAMHTLSWQEQDGRHITIYIDPPPRRRQSTTKSPTPNTPAKVN
jgi:hypothetical protein